MCKSCDFVDDCIAEYVERMNFLVVFPAVKNYCMEQEENYRKEIVKQVYFNLPSHYKPDRILFFGETLPINGNGTFYNILSKF